MNSLAPSSKHTFFSDLAKETATSSPSPYQRSFRVRRSSEARPCCEVLTKIQGDRASIG